MADSAVDWRIRAPVIVMKALLMNMGIDLYGDGTCLRFLRDGNDRLRLCMEMQQYPGRIEGESETVYGVVGMTLADFVDSVHAMPEDVVVEIGANVALNEMKREAAAKRV